MSTPLLDLITHRRVLVCAGAGGVGKTSVSCALALGAARQGRRVLAVTIDPSRRLAEALGVAAHSPEPTAISADRLRAAGVEPPGSLSAWMLDPQVVSDQVVQRFSQTPQEAERLMQNRIYRNVTAMVAGMQEYTAVEAMHGFVTRGEYDLVVLDTPPSRNALHFLEAPSRITRFLDGRVFRFFLPSEEGLVSRAASLITEKVMDAAFGAENRQELMTFFLLFSTILKRLGRDAAEMREFFRRPEVAFLVVTSPAQEALEEAIYFERKTRHELSLPLAGYVLNRSMASSGSKRFPEAEVFSRSAVSAGALAKLQQLARAEQEEQERHAAVLRDLEGRLGGDGFAVAAPYLSEGVNDIPTLTKLVDALAGSRKPTLV